MTEDEHLAVIGLQPQPKDLPAIRLLLATETARERAAQGDGDITLMKLCSVQLFNSGMLADVLPIWQAKTASFDADCSVDVQLLCGSGLARTKAFLSEQGSAAAQAALRRLEECEAAGDFEGFSVEEYARWWNSYYAGGAGEPRA